MDTYIQNLFKKTNSVDQNLDLDKNGLISQNAINNFQKMYNVKKQSFEKFNNIYGEELKETLKNVNDKAVSRKAKYIGLSDLVQSGGEMNKMPYDGYCHNNIGQCSDSYKAGCGQTGGNSKLPIPKSVFKKMAESHSNFIIPKNVLEKLQHIVNDNVLEKIKNN